MAYIRIFCLSILFLLPPVVEAQDDACLPLSDEDLQTRHTAGFILAYSECHEQAGDVGRTDNFRSDGSIITGGIPNGRFFRVFGYPGEITGVQF